MRIIHIGLPRSGNYMLHRMLTGLMREAGIEPRRWIRQQPIHDDLRAMTPSFPEQADVDMLDIRHGFCEASAGFVFQQRIDNIPAYLEQTNLVWTNAPLVRGADAVLRRFDRCIYVVRDPRDALLSHADFLFTDCHKRQAPTAHGTPEAAVEQMLEQKCFQWLEHVAGYVDASRGLPLTILRFEDMVADRRGMVARLDAVLGLGLAGDAIDRVAEETDVEIMRAQAPGIVNRGLCGAWAERLSERQNARAVDLLGGTLAALGYPKRPGDAIGPMPQQPAGSFLDRAPRHAVRLIRERANSAVLRDRVEVLDRQRTRLLSRLSTVPVRLDEGWTLEGLRPFGAGSLAQAGTSPMGDAFRVVEDETTGMHRVHAVVLLNGDGPRRFSVVARPNGRQHMALWLMDAATGESGLEARFDLDTGRLVDHSGYGGSRRPEVSVETLAWGWKRYSITGRLPAGLARASIVLRADAEGPSPYGGDGGSGLLLSVPLVHRPDEG